MSPFLQEPCRVSRVQLSLTEPGWGNRSVGAVGLLCVWALRGTVCERFKLVDASAPSLGRDAFGDEYSARRGTMTNRLNRYIGR
jgi:hypothetical protein